MGKSSKDKRDIYYRKAKEQGWRARSAFKLLQLNEEFDLFKGVTRVVDLCAAPGSWSQALSKEIFGKPHSDDARIVAVDLQPMSLIDHVTTLQADITHPKTLEKILEIFGGEKADFVCSDGAPDVTGLHDLDEYIQAQLILSALQLATCVLKVGGTFVAKVFRGRDIDLLYGQLSYLFDKVICAKPRASRSSSLESFIVCIGYRPRPGWKPELRPDVSTEEFFQGMGIGRAKLNDDLSVDDEERKIAPFIACGDLNGSYDSDATYPIDKKDASSDSKKSLDPVQMPTAPPYKKALEMKRKGELRVTK